MALTSTSALLDEVVAVLTAALPAVAVELYPQRPAAYRLNHPVGAVLVAYRGAEFGPQLQEWDDQQEQRARWGTVLVFRELYGRAGALPALDLVRATLARYQPAGARARCKVLGERFLEHEAGLWIYATEWEAAYAPDLADWPAPATLDDFVTFHADYDLPPADGTVDAVDDQLLPQ